MVRKTRRGRILAVLLIGLVVCPAVALAGSLPCVRQSHDCAPMPASLSRCCVAPVDTGQPSLTVSVAFAYEPAAARGTIGDLLETVPEIVARSGVGPPSFRPIDRLSLFGQFLI
jgi:hypothetical protein